MATLTRGTTRKTTTREIEITGCDACRYNYTAVFPQRYQGFRRRSRKLLILNAMQSASQFDDRQMWMRLPHWSYALYSRL